MMCPPLKYILCFLGEQYTLFLSLCPSFLFHMVNPLFPFPLGQPALGVNSPDVVPSQLPPTIYGTSNITERDLANTMTNCRIIGSTAQRMDFVSVFSLHCLVFPGKISAVIIVSGAQSIFGTQSYS